MKMTNKKGKKYISEFINIKNFPNKKLSDLKIPFYNINEFFKYELKSFIPYDTYSHYHYYYMYNKYFPCTVKISNINVKKFLKDLFTYFSIPKNSYIKEENVDILNNNINSIYDIDDETLDSILILLDKDLVLYTNSFSSLIIYYNNNDHFNENSLFFSPMGALKSYIYYFGESNKIFIIFRDETGFNKRGFEIKKTKINIDENYNDDFLEVSKKIIKGLNDTKKSNLVILSGETGTGKTTYIRYLTSKIKKNIIFVPPDMVESITDPGFISFLMYNNNSVLIIEDAEPILKKRNEYGRTSAISNVLNLTDGLLSDCLNISIVATFNTTNKIIDDALLRKGRLLIYYNFERLSIDKSKNLLNKLGYNVDVKEPMTLADIYFYNDDNNKELLKKDLNKNKIGFIK